MLGARPAEYDVCLHCLDSDFNKAILVLMNIQTSYQRNVSLDVLILSTGDAKQEVELEVGKEKRTELQNVNFTAKLYDEVKLEEIPGLSKSHFFIFAPETFPIFLSPSSEKFSVALEKIMWDHEQIYLPIFFTSNRFPWKNENHIFWLDPRLDEISPFSKREQPEKYRGILERPFDEFVDRYQFPDLSSTASWGCAKGLDCHDFFLSHRVETDRHLVKEVALRLDAANGKHCAFYDKRCLVRGESWVEGFCNGLLRSKVVVLFMSVRALLGVGDGKPILMEEDDNMLLEWRISHGFKTEDKSGELITIVPVLIADGKDGKTVEDEVILNEIQQKYPWEARHSFLEKMLQRSPRKLIEEILKDTDVQRLSALPTDDEILNLVTTLRSKVSDSATLYEKFESRVEVYEDWKNVTKYATGFANYPSNLVNVHKDIKDKLNSWQCVKHISRHDFHISYRINSHKDAKFLKFSLEERNIDGRRVHAFLDDHCLVPGCDPLFHCICSVLTAHVVVAIITPQSLERIRVADKQRDTMFAEWENTVWSRDHAFFPILINLRPEEVNIDLFPQVKPTHIYSLKGHTIRETMTRVLEICKKYPENMFYGGVEFTHLIPRLLLFRERSGLPESEAPKSNDTCNFNVTLKKHSFFFSAFDNKADKENARKLALITDGDMYAHRTFHEDCVDKFSRFTSLIYARLIVLIISEDTIGLLKNVNVDATSQNKIRKQLIEWNAVMNLNDQNLVKVIPVFIGEEGKPFSKFRELGSLPEFSVSTGRRSKVKFNLKDIFRRVLLLHGVFADPEAVEVPELIRHLGNSEKLSKNLIESREKEIEEFKSELK
ncbi:hypothetical protein HK098_002934 [Nowakowskiella sp. JEL0407]|nr:hypothetical protein HK098_002934 [Nowakowskiella sp. JEL0407]